MKKKILFLLPGFHFGGTVFSTLNMISFLRDYFDITVLPMTYQGPVIKYYLEAGIKLYPESIILSALTGRTEMETKCGRKVLFAFLKGSRHILSKLSIDFDGLVITSIARQIEKKNYFDFVASCQEGAATYFAACFKKSKRIAWFRNEYSIYRTEYPQIALKKDQIVYPLFDKIVCVSKTTRNDFSRYFPNISDRIIAIHNIQDVDSIISKANERIDDFPESSFVIVSVGRINPQKRFSSIPLIARRLLDAGCNFQWIIIGDGNVFGERDRLEAEIKNNNVKDSVKFLGGKLNPYPYIKRAHLLVNTSYVEACPRVVIEAKLLKTPVICTDFSSAREFVTPDYDGYVETIESIHIPIINMLKNYQLYKRIKTTCNLYKIDNDHVLKQLKNLFS